MLARMMGRPLGLLLLGLGFLLVSISPGRGQQLVKQLARSFRDVFAREFNSDNRASTLNAALMLPPVAKLKQEDIGDLLVEMLKDKKLHDAVKLFAAKAMREFLPATIVTEDDDP